MRWWIKLIFGLLVIALMVTVIIRLGSFTIDIMGAYKDDKISQQDPMFAEEPTVVTPPPETESGNYIPRDHSSEWDTFVQTPVDRTAEELAQDDQ